MQVPRKSQAAIIAVVAAFAAQSFAFAQVRSYEEPRATPPAVQPSTPSARRSAGQTIDDATITARVKAALVRDKRVKAITLDVDTKRGVVELKGKVANQQEAATAVSLAQQVDGVVRVENKLSVASPSTSS
jgi:hyperosmotically inducible protein